MSDSYDELFFDAPAPNPVTLDFHLTIETVIASVAVTTNGGDTACKPTVDGRVSFTTDALGRGPNSIVVVITAEAAADPASDLEVSITQDGHVLPPHADNAPPGNPFTIDALANTDPTTLEVSIAVPYSAAVSQIVSVGLAQLALVEEPQI